jgi:hypothetical protein
MERLSVIVSLLLELAVLESGLLLIFNSRYDCEWWRNVQAKVGAKNANDMKSEYKMTTFRGYLNSFMVKK